MSCRAAVLAVAGVIATASTSVAQTREPLPRIVADVRAMSTGMTTGLGWTPPVPQGTEVPGRSLGLETGAHVYLLRMRLGGLGLGASLLHARGKTSPPEPPSTGTTPPPPTPTPVTIPDVSTRMTSFLPHVSFNFGHRQGFSYISAGLGRTRVSSTATLPTAATPPETTESPWTRTLHYGGGARWFFKDHLAFSLEVRFYKVSAVDASATQAALPKQSLLVLGGGISIK